ncbi:SMP-30/gluconolactonase/LRE family protein [Sphingomonas sp. MMS24-J13]|uniref:SMP-30/gluconolactonase/LRE family protein n=1 Tax=Sphingomonas sp. MMS24-J13 TaxID=3238686 RepID=UPI00385056B4
MMKRIVFAALALLEATGAHAAAPCPSSDGLHYICGPVGSEDLARVPGTSWLIASGIRTDVPGRLYRIDTRTGRAEALTIAIRPDPVLAKDCPAPLDPSRLSIDGIGLRGRRLYGANHGGRQAIEIFDIDRQDDKPRLTWIGCAPTPIGTLANSVAPLPDGGIVVTSFYDPRDMAAWERMGRGEPTGSLWEWHSDRGFRRMDVGPISGANGLAISRDAGTLYVSAWSSHALLAIDRQTLGRRTIALDFMPDNLKLAADGTLFVAGQATTVASIAACTGPVCAQNWVVARVGPERGTVTKLIARAGNATVSYACGALAVGDRLYITARADRRLITMPLSELPSLR